MWFTKAALLIVNELIAFHSIDDDYWSTCTSNQRVVIDHEGTVKWFCKVSLVIGCPIDITFFPYDSQTCPIDVENFIYSPDQVHFTADEGLEIISRGDAEWSMGNTSLESCFYTNDDGVNHKKIKFIMNLSRKHAYYDLYLVAPIILLNFASIAMFWLPADSGEKASYAITVMLAYTVLQVSVQSSIPVASQDIPYISKSYLCFTWNTYTWFMSPFSTLNLTRLAASISGTDLKGTFVFQVCTWPLWLAWLLGQSSLTSLSYRSALGLESNVLAAALAPSSLAV